MARRAEGWSIKWHRGIAHVRFRFNGKRESISTGSRDPVEAPGLCAQLYADFVSGKLKRASTGALIHPNTPVDEMCADWIADVMVELGEGYDDTLEVYARHWSKHFKVMGNVNTAMIGDYGRKRLGAVQRSTVIKERGAFRRFCTWMVEKGLLREVPEFPKLAKKAIGTKHKQARSKPQVQLSPAEVERILAALPEWSARSPRGMVGKRAPMRAYFVTCYETGLRPEGTIDRLEGRDLTLAGLHIRPECDKNRWERVVPLSPRARAALESVGPRGPRELIFGVFDRREAFAKACAEALGPERGALVTPYDLKHALVTHLLESGATPLGVEFLTGTTVALDQYAHPTRRAAEAAIGVLLGSTPIGDECEGEDLNLHGNNPASTSSESESENSGENEGGDSDGDPLSSGSRCPSGSGTPHVILPAIEALSLAAAHVLRKCGPRPPAPAFESEVVNG